MDEIVAGGRHEEQTRDITIAPIFDQTGRGRDRRPFTQHPLQAGRIDLSLEILRPEVLDDLAGAAPDGGAVAAQRLQVNRTTSRLCDEIRYPFFKSFPSLYRQ